MNIYVSKAKAVTMTHTEMVEHRISLNYVVPQYAEIHWHLCILSPSTACSCRRPRSNPQSRDAERHGL